jgi:hypothetical protein
MTLSARIVRQLSNLACRVGRVAAGVMIAIVFLGDNARAIPNQDLPVVESAISEDGTLLISWTGPVVVGMSAYLRGVIEKHASVSRRIMLHLDSVGGDVEEGERAIAVLQEVKATHGLVTVVLHVTSAPACACRSISRVLIASRRLPASG